MSISASQWGSPNASRRALLIHGMSMCSNSWEGVAQLLVADGFFVIAPNLLGHGWRQGGDFSFSVSALADDLRSYLATDSYDVIIGHSLGGPVALSLLPFLPKEKEVTVILVDPALEIPDGGLKINEKKFLQEVISIRSPDEHMSENPAWSRRDCVLRTLGLSMCNHPVIEKLFQHNKPWSYSGLFKNVTPNVKISVLISDPKLSPVCRLEHIPPDVKRSDAKVITGTGHWIQFDRADAIMDAVPLPRAKL